jgi:hypothetical protein
MEQLKLCSLFYYLSEINLKGYAKWTVLNQVVKEVHPTGESLFELM